jgi:LAO/AO transport system kinase
LSINPEKYNEWAAQRKAYSEGLTAAQLFPKLRMGDRGALASAITLIESTNPTHRTEANALITLCLPHSGNAWRIGITGVPGVGKSTFIEAIGHELLNQGHRLAVMAIDPSSSISGGSILGDKTRMESLSMREDVFIRPTATGKTLGGVAQHTRETIIVCEAAGYDIIFVETVGVGQSETVVHSMVDFFLLLMLSGAGDELQGIKRGIMEMADGILITKADQGNEEAAKHAKRTYQNALHLFTAKDSGWIPKVACISSIEKTALNHPLTWWKSYFDQVTQSGYLSHKRKDQDLRFFEESFQQQLSQFMANNEQIHKGYKDLQSQVLDGRCSPYEAADHLLHLITTAHGNL